MTYGGHYSKTAKKAINRFYEHADTRTLTLLQELVGEVYLAEGKAADKLWAKAGEALAKAGVPAAQVASVVDARDAKKFAEMVSGLLKGGR